MQKKNTKNKQSEETKPLGIDMKVRMIYEMQKYFRVFRISIYDKMAEIRNRRPWKLWRMTD